MPPVAARMNRHLALSGATTPAQGPVASWQSGVLSSINRAIATGTDLTASELTAIVAQFAHHLPADFALRSGRAERLADLGLIGHAIASCSTLEQALAVWRSHADVHAPLLRFQSQMRGPDWRIAIQPVPGLAAPVRRFIVEEWLASFFAFLDETTGITRPSARIELRHAARPDVAYAQWLTAMPHFQATSYRLILPADLLRSPLRSRDDEMLNIILEHFQHHPAASRSHADQLRRMLMSHLGLRPSLPGCASRLGISPRTLVRRLASEGTSFSAVLDGFRRDQALALAREGRLGAKDIARGVGFESHQSLRRAFVKWTGHPLRQWRNAQRPDAGFSVDTPLPGDAPPRS